MTERIRKVEAAGLEGYWETEDVLADAGAIIESAQRRAYAAVNEALVRRNWLLGRRIAVDELKGAERAKYGAETIAVLSKELTARYGRGFAKNNLYRFVSFYKEFPEIFPTVLGKSQTLLSWSHYLVLLQVKDPKARAWYEHEAADQMWAVRTLQRNVGSQYYERMLLSQHPEPVQREMERLTDPYQADKLEFIRNPVVAEFLNLTPNSDLAESKLETAILNHLQKFMAELGKGYAFVARQKHVHTEKADYFIDLVFFNYELNCFVLVDLKTSKITHQDVGQMDMYVRMYDERVRREWHNPTLGIVLCTETDEDIAHYSVLHDSDQLFASKYMLYLPTTEQLRAEIETQKQMFYLQQGE